jgi:hypothetical protein
MQSHLTRKDLIVRQPLGPLVISGANPRYFAAAGAPERRSISHGSHVNNNLHDGLGFGRECPEDPERFDFDAYLKLLTERGSQLHSALALGAVSWPTCPGQCALLYDAPALAAYRTGVS